MLKKAIWLILLGITVLVGACTAEPATEQPVTVADKPTITVYHDPNCGCCTNWIAYLEEAGYPLEIIETANSTPLKERFQVPRDLRSCHTAVVDGYVLEGHVPLAEIDRLLVERPDVIGIAVPGMPLGSPGMELPGAEPQPYQVIAFHADGTQEIFGGYE